MTKWKVPPIWQDGECYIIGGGPSIPKQFGVPDELIEDVKDNAVSAEYYSKYMKPIHDKHIIGVNRAYRLGDWVDICFFGDCGFYLKHRTELADFPGLKITCCPRFGKKDKEKREGIKYLEKDNNKRKGITKDPTKVSWNYNSGAASISLARHLGVSTIYLLGFDMSGDNEKSYHWHDSYGARGRKTKSPSFNRHMKGFNKIAKDLDKMGIDVINLSPDSNLECFPKKSVKDVFDA